MIPSNKIDLDFFSATEGDKFTYKGKKYIVVGKHYDTGFMLLRAVRENPPFEFTMVREVYHYVKTN